jgi:hypothetical protein
VRFFNESDKLKFNMMYGLTKESVEDENPYKDVLDRRDSQIQDILSFKRSQAAKHAWDKLRFRYKIGLDRYYRSPAGQDTRKRIGDQLRGGLSTLDAFGYKCGHSEAKDFLTDIVRLKADIFEGLSYWMLEEETAEYILLAEAAFEALSEIERAFLIGTEVSDKSWEVLLNLVRNEVFSEVTIRSLPDVQSEDSSLLSIFKRKMEERIKDIEEK